MHLFLCLLIFRSAIFRTFWRQSVLSHLCGRSVSRYETVPTVQSRTSPLSNVVLVMQPILVTMQVNRRQMAAIPAHSFSIIIIFPCSVKISSFSRTWRSMILAPFISGINSVSLSPLLCKDDHSKYFCRTNTYLGFSSCLYLASIPLSPDQLATLCRTFVLLLK